MLQKILNFIKSYFAALNMNSGAVLFRRRKVTYISESDQKQKFPWINLILFVLTFCTTTLAGAQADGSIPEIIISGLPFSITIMLILLSHEMGHYIAARRFGMKVTLPYFIPFPSIIGTMGAVIKIKSPIRDKRALLYVGAMGPLIGFLLSLIASIAGIYFSEIRILPAGTNGLVPVFGNSILFGILTKIIHGSIPHGYDIFLSPYAWAGWIGFLVTSLNLMPIGQLDGSHIIYALIGRKQIYIGWIMLSGLVVLSFFWPGWIVWILITLFLLMVGHPPVEDGPVLSAAEKIMGWFCVVIFILTFIPVPVNFM